jgi:hypothetical protein
MKQMMRRVGTAQSITEFVNVLTNSYKRKQKPFVPIELQLYDKDNEPEPKRQPNDLWIWPVDADQIWLDGRKKYESNPVPPTSVFLPTYDRSDTRYQLGYTDLATIQDWLDILLDRIAHFVQLHKYARMVIPVSNYKLWCPRSQTSDKIKTYILENLTSIARTGEVLQP